METTERSKIVAELTLELGYAQKEASELKCRLHGLEEQNRRLSIEAAKLLLSLDACEEKLRKVVCAFGGLPADLVPEVVEDAKEFLENHDEQGEEIY